MSGSSGRGPTIDMSPRSTLKSCGSSSILVRRNSAPSGKTRGSSCPVMRLAGAGRRWCMVRSLYMVKGAPARPTRRARYSTGPGLARRIPSAASASTARPRAASTMSSRRFAMAARPADGEEHLRRFQAGLVAPRPGAVAERLERAGVWIRPDLALVARHGGDLGLERLGDIHPRVGHKAARVGPFGAARGIERIDCANALLGGPRGDERGLEQQLMVAVHVPAVLAIHDVGMQLPHQTRERRDHVRERQRVEPLVGEPQHADVVHTERAGRATSVLRLTDAFGSVAERLAFAGDGRVHLVPRARVQRDRAAAPQHFVVGWAAITRTRLGERVLIDTGPHATGPQLVA